MFFIIFNKYLSDISIQIQMKFIIWPIKVFDRPARWTERTCGLIYGASISPTKENRKFLVSKATIAFVWITIWWSINPFCTFNVSLFKVFTK